jgi:uncharacterized membrane protein YphA (DoxX/SURF4 family)
MNVALWAVQALLAVAFLAAGFMKASQPIARLATSMAWVKAVPSALVRFIGVAEVLGAIGLVLPLLTGILPWLTPLAAVGLMIVMLGAVAFHGSRHEYPAIGFNVVLFVLAAFVAYGRFAVVTA